MKGKRKNNKHELDYYKSTVLFDRDGLIITENHIKKIFEIGSDEKLSPETIKQLRKDGYKWDNQKYLWYAPSSIQSLEAAIRLMENQIILKSSEKEL